MDLPFDTSALRERAAAEEFSWVQASALGNMRKGLGTRAFVSITHVTLEECAREGGGKATDLSY